MEKNEFKQLVMLIKGLYPRDDKLFADTVQMNIWYSMLCDIGYTDALKAVQKHAQESPFPPSIADIRRGSEDMTDWLIAYDEAIRIIGKYGTYRRKEGLSAMDEVMRETVSRIGYDRIALSEMHDPHIKREFKELYEHTAKEHRYQQSISAAEAGEHKCLTAK